MFNKNDPLISSVQKVMEENARRRDIEQKLCEELGIYSRKQLPHEHQVNYDALLEQRLSEASKENKDKDQSKKNAENTKKTFPNVKYTTKSGHPDWEKHGIKDIPTVKEALHPNQQKLDVHEPEKDKLTAHDFKMLRAKGKSDYSKMREKMVGKGTDRETTRKLVGEEEGDETREGGAVVDTKTNKPVVSSTAPQASGTGPSQAERAALTNKIKQMKEAMLAGAETGPRKTPGSNQPMSEEQIAEKAPPGAKYERMVKHIKKGYEKGGVTDKEKSIAYATAWKAKKKEEMKESLTFDDVMEEIKKKIGDKKMKEIDEQEDDKGTTPNPLRGSRYDTGTEGETPTNTTQSGTTPKNTTDVSSNNGQTQVPSSEPSARTGSSGLENRLKGAQEVGAAKRLRLNEPPSEPSSSPMQINIPALVRRPESTAGSGTSIPPGAAKMAPSNFTPSTPETSRQKLDRLMGDTGPKTMATAPKPSALSTPSASSAGPKPADASKPPTRPATTKSVATPAARPQATAPSAPTPPDYSSSDDWGGSSSSFFAQDRARQEAGKVSGPYNPAIKAAARPAARPMARASARPMVRESLETTIKNIIKG